MKRALLTCFLVLCCISSLWGAKAIREPLAFTQPDGKTVRVVLNGDEHGSYYLSEDGAILVRDNNAFYLADMDADGLKPTSVLVHDRCERTAVEAEAIARQDRTKLFAHIDALRERNLFKASIREETPAYVMHSGSPKILVLLAEFSDCPFSVSDPQKTFNQFFNAVGENTHLDFGHDEHRNYVSVSEYFRICSGGAFSPEFVVSEPVCVGNMDLYGGKSKESSNDENVSQLVEDAMSKLEGKYDFKDFDNDGDGRLDCVFVVYAGYGQNNGGPANSIWAKCGGINRTVCGIQLSWYTCISELNYYDEYFKKKGVQPWVNGIGVACHEFSHALGLPDLYPTRTSAYLHNQEMEYWDLMDAGEYVYHGYYPRDYSAWEREVMGWSTIEPLTSDVQKLTISPLLDGGKAYKFCNPADAEEYFVLENIQKRGLNKKIYGHGLIVYHVKYPYEYVFMSGAPNNDPGKPGVAIVPADGIVVSSYVEDEHKKEYQSSLGGDPFPGTSEVCALSSSLNLPNYVWYAGEPEVKDGLLNILESEESGDITLTYYKDFSASLPAIEYQQPMSPYYDLQGRPAGILQRGLYIQEGRKVLRQY